MPPPPDFCSARIVAEIADLKSPFAPGAADRQPPPATPLISL